MVLTSPKIKIEDTHLSEENYIRCNKLWKTSQLVDFCEEKKYQPFKAPLACFDLSFMNFPVSNLNSFILQCKRALDADLKYPIIIDDLGIVANGYHRIVKAILEGKTEIDCIRMEEMPDNYEEYKCEE